MTWNRDGVADRAIDRDAHYDAATDDGDRDAGRWFGPRLLDAVDDILWIASHDGELLRWNDRLAAVTGSEASELTGLSAGDLCSAADESRVVQSIETAAQTGADTVTVDVRTADGGAVAHEFRSRRLPGSGAESAGVVSVGRDISERQARERRLIRRNERLDEFAETVAHDIRSPLNVIDAHRELASRAAADDGADHLEKIERAVSRIERIVDDVLWLAREGRAIDTTSSVVLQELVDDAWAMAAADAPRATLRSAGCDRTLDTDADRVRQLLENLFRNAVEHGGDAVTVTVGTTSDGFFVADDGPGLPEDERDRVFDSGYSTAEGTGLGLSVVTDVADAHGWTVDAAAAADGGARFEFVVEEPDAGRGEPVKSTIDDVWTDISDAPDPT